MVAVAVIRSDRKSLHRCTRGGNFGGLRFPLILFEAISPYQAGPEAIESSLRKIVYTGWRNLRVRGARERNVLRARKGTDHTALEIVQRRTMQSRLTRSDQTNGQQRDLRPFSYSHAERKLAAFFSAKLDLARIKRMECAVVEDEYAVHQLTQRHT
jgi:hypothetical protein